MRGSASGAAHRQCNEHRANAPCKRGQCDRRIRRDADRKRDDRSNRGATGYAQQVRLGEGIAQSALQSSAARSEAGADQCAEQNAREAQIADDRYGGGITPASQRVQHRRNRQRNRAASDGNHGYQNERRDQQPPVSGSELFHRMMPG